MMISFIVFGKPRAFESYEFVFGREIQSAENTHSEPKLKPRQFDDPVLHYFCGDGHAGIEYYTRAKGSESARPGITFGVAVKTTKDFNIADTASKILVKYWRFFANVLLDGNSTFRSPSILQALKSTSWSSEEIKELQGTVSSSPAKAPGKKTLLLVCPDTTALNQVEDEIKSYADVYLSASAEVFNDPDNAIILREAGGEIHQIADGQIVLFEPTPQTQSDLEVGSTNGRKPSRTSYGSMRADSSVTPSAEPVPASRPAMTIRQYILVWGILSVAVNLLTLFFVAGPKLANAFHGHSVEEVDSLPIVKLSDYQDGINEDMELNPQFVELKIDSFVAIPRGLVQFEGNKLKVINRLDTDTTIVVKAYMEGYCVAKQKYKINRKQQQ